MKRCIWFCTALLCFAMASQIVAQVLTGPRGPVEFIGLEEWTASELFKAIQETDPDNSFHACAAVMKRDLDFPDAAAFGFFKQQEDGSQELYTVVVGVEDGSQVRYRTAGSETVDLPETWQELQTVTEDNFQTLSAAAYVRYLLAIPETARQLAELSDSEAQESSHQFAEMFGSNAQMFDILSTFVDGTDKESDYRLALEVLEKDESWSARAVATIVLAQFSDNDATWHGLADSLIDPAQQVRDIAEKLLEGLVRAEKAVPVQWSEARETLLALFGGTYPFAFNKILNALVATEVDPEFGQELLLEKPKLLLAFAGAEQEKTREPARDFLNTIYKLNQPTLKKLKD